MSRLLVIGNEPDMLILVRTALEKDGHQVDIEMDASAVPPALCSMYDLILLDVMMPGKDGFSLYNRIRAEGDCPILCLIAKLEEAALVRGLSLGADDYIQKPFSISHLLTRINARLWQQARQPIRTLNRSGVCFDMQAKVAAVDEHRLPLTRGEYAICEYLALHAGRVFTKEQLYEAVFGLDAEGDPSVIVAHIKNIRAKLRSDGLFPIETVWRVGYKWQNDGETLIDHLAQNEMLGASK